MFRRLFVTLAFLASAIPAAFAQGSGQLAPLQVWGNATSLASPAAPTNFSAFSKRLDVTGQPYLAKGNVVFCGNGGDAAITSGTNALTANCATVNAAGG